MIVEPRTEQIELSREGRWIVKHHFLGYQDFAHSVCSECGNNIKFRGAKMNME